MFNEHNFQLSDPTPTTRLISPVGTLRFSDYFASQSTQKADYAVVTNPITKEREHWLGCFSKSRLDGVRERTRAIRLVVVLDVSGSMSDTLTPPRARHSSFPLPPFPHASNFLPKTEEDLFKLKPKLEVAKGAILELIKNLRGT